MCLRQKKIESRGRDRAFKSKPSVSSSEVWVRKMGEMKHFFFFLSFRIKGMKITWIYFKALLWEGRTECVTPTNKLHVWRYLLSLKVGCRSRHHQWRDTSDLLPVHQGLRYLFPLERPLKKNYLQPDNSIPTNKTLKHDNSSDCVIVEYSDADVRFLVLCRFHAFKRKEKKKTNLLFCNFIMYAYVVRACVCVRVYMRVDVCAQLRVLWAHKSVIINN